MISNGLGRELFIPKQDLSGFDVIVQAETYGLYPFAGEWHGAPWELSPNGHRPRDQQIEELCVQFLGFIQTLLSADSILEVHYTGRLPFRWVLEYETELGPEAETCGLLVYNYFGKKRMEILQNRHLPGRYVAR